MFRLTEYWPLRGVADPIALGTIKQSFKACDGIEDYDIFDVDGDVFVFRKAFVAGQYKETAALRCMAHGFGVIRGKVAENMLEEFSHECPRPQPKKEKK